MSVESGYIDLSDMSGSEGRRSLEETSSTSSVFLPFDKLMDKVKTFVREKGIMLEDNFHEYDPLRKGYVRTSDFKKALKEVFQELLTDEQAEEIQSHYCDQDNPECCNWPKFLHDAETEFTAQPSNPTTDPLKKALLKRVAQQMKGKMDISNLLPRASSLDINSGFNDQEFDTQAEEFFQLLSAVTKKEDLKVVMDMYTDEMGFKYQELLHDLQEMDDIHKGARSPFKRSKVSPQSPGCLIEIPEDELQTSQKPSLSIPRSRRRFTISYEALVWIIFLVVTTLCVVDHFVLKGDVVLGRNGKLPKRIWGTNIGETITNVVWAVTARMIITSQNLMFYTMLWCFPNFISEIAPKWITMDGIRDVHSRMHRFAGIFLIAIPSLAHVLVIFVPPLIDGTDLKYYPPSTFNFSKYPYHMNWTKFWDPAAVQGWTFNDHTGVHLTSDEIYRFTLVIVLFCFFFPLSRSNYATQRSYSFAMALHVFAGIWYAIDNIRKITHGLSQVVNLPMLVIWCIDRLLSIWIYRHHRGRIVRKEVIGNNEYVVLYIKLNKDVKCAVGDVYYLLHEMKGSTGILPQRSHPFTTFANLSQDSTWDIGFVISIIDDEKQLYLPWTSWLANNDKASTFHAWGPYRSSVWTLYNKLVDVSDGQPPSHYVLFATGSGCGYVLDVLSCLAYKSKPSQHGSQASQQIKIDIFYSVRCKAFYHFLRKPIGELMKKIKEKNAATINFRFYVTNPEEEEEGEDEIAATHIQLINGRIDFEKALKSTNKKTCCYFVGRPEVGKIVEKLCEKKGVTLVQDYTNGRGNEKDGPLLMKYLKISFWIVLLITAICITVSAVIDVRSIKRSLQTYAMNKTN
ncbi:hypothetical protein OS493_028242 [Desmophyllum pertusum]|uniref:Ferric reductase NAD binding domain-containing protein n=1 Tax=Desmophyllum pertusum TaxID=174260 RepID=A0A9X0CIY0_9CNID|nr:hypothetical protein OS493_028242 [Desmophyllum pertusum]